MESKKKKSYFIESEVFFKVYWPFNFYKIKPPFWKHTGCTVLQVHLSQFSRVLLNGAPGTRLYS